MKSTSINLCIKLIKEDLHIEFEVRKLLNAGYTYRDKKYIDFHVEEMKKAGIGIPEKIPIFFPKLTDRITTAGRIEVLSENTTSGEIEFVLLFHGQRLYVGVGSDHTDRVLERVNILASKQIYPNIISREVWLYDDIKDHWDDIEMRSWVRMNGERRLYQEAKLDRIMKVQDLIQEAKKWISADMNGTVLYAGTIPSIDGEMCYSRYFEAALIDEKMRRTITCNYSIEAVNWFKEECKSSIP